MKKQIIITGTHVLYTTMIIYSLFIIYSFVSSIFELKLLIPYGFFALAFVLSKFEAKGKRFFEIKIGK